MVKIRLTRIGRKQVPVYGIIVAEEKMPRDGKFIEKLGTYDPIKKTITLNIERYNYWKGVGAQETEAAARVFKKSQESK